MAPVERCNLLILGVFPTGEHAKVVHAYTDRFGLQRYYLYGTHGKSSVVRPAHLLPLTFLEAVVTRKGRGQLEQIREVRSLDAHAPRHPLTQSVAMLVAEIWSNALREGESDEGFYADALLWRAHLVASLSPSPMAVVEALLLLLEHLGLDCSPPAEPLWMDLREGLFSPHPPVHPDHLAPEVVQVWGEWAVHASLPPQPYRSQLVDGLIRYLEVQLTGFKPPKSLPLVRLLSDDRPAGL
jgi:hypothetical protein